MSRGPLSILEVDVLPCPDPGTDKLVSPIGQGIIFYLLWGEGSLVFAVTEVDDSLLQF
jgi:hypothetical protein